MDNKIKVCHICNLGMNGKAVFVCNLLENIDFEKYEVTILNYRAEHAAPIISRLEKLPVKICLLYTSQYMEEEEGKEELKGEIEEYLAGEYRGREEPGAIVSSRNVIAVVDWKQMLCQPEMEKYGEMIMESAWFESLKENLSNMHTYEHDRLKRMYSPVFEMCIRDRCGSDCLKHRNC